MDRDAEQLAGGLFHLASGSSRLWRVDVDESSERGVRFVNLDGPTVYLTMQIDNLQVIEQTIDFLQRHLNRVGVVKPLPWIEEEDAIRLGTFAQAPVELLWDVEWNDQCYLVVSPTHEAMRLTLRRDDTETLLDALRQVAANVPKEEQ